MACKVRVEVLVLVIIFMAHTNKPGLLCTTVFA